MRDDARNKALPRIQYSCQKESDCHRIEYLTDCLRIIGTVSVNKIDYMSYSKCNACDNDGALYAAFAHSLKQKASEQRFLCNTDNNHGGKIDQRGQQTHFETDTEPDIHRGNNGKRYII